jgi:hypothetical protein
VAVTARRQRHEAKRFADTGQDANWREHPPSPPREGETRAAPNRMVASCLPDYSLREPRTASREAERVGMAGSVRSRPSDGAPYGAWGFIGRVVATKRPLLRSCGFVRLRHYNDSAPLGLDCQRHGSSSSRSLLVRVTRQCAVTVGRKRQKHPDICKPPAGEPELRDRTTTVVYPSMVAPQSPSDKED